MAYSNTLDNMRDGWESPCPNAEAVVADTPFTKTCRAIYVGGAGNVSVQMAGSEGSSTVVFTAVPAGTILPVRCTQVNSASTATSMTAMW